MKTIELLVKKTKAGDDYHVFKMEDGKYLSIFKFDSRFSEINVGTDLPDDVLVYDQQYNNYKLKELPKPAGGSRGGGNSAAITKAQDTKREDIKDAQERKKEDIAQAAAFRDATLITVEWVKSAPFPMDHEIKEYWKSWVKFFLAMGDQPFQ